MLTLWSKKPLDPVEQDIVLFALSKSGIESHELLSGRQKPQPCAPGSPVILMGSADSSNEFMGRPLVPTLSPAQLRTKPDALTALTSALKLAQRMERGRITRQTGEYTLLDSVSDAVEWVHTSNASGSPIYLDIETQGDIKRLHHSQRGLLCIGMHNEDGHTVIVPGPIAQAAQGALLAELSEAKLVAHNGKFDLPVLAYALGGQPRDLQLAFDTQLAHYVLFPAAAFHGLKPLAQRFLGAQDWGREEDMTNLAALPEDELYSYNALDVQYGWELFDIFAEMLEANPDAAKAFYATVIPASNMFAEIEPNGIGYDPDYTREELAEDLKWRAAQHRKELVRMAHTVLPRTKTVTKARSKNKETYFEDVEVPYTFNPGSPKQLKELYAATGRVLDKTDKEVMEARAASGDKFAKELLEWRHVTKQLGTYVESTLDKMNTVMGSPRIFPSYKIHGTVTGRLSSENPNIQNIPRDKRLRKMFVPYAEDRRLLQVDMSQAELRIIAAEAGDPWLLEIFHNPEVDVFSQMLPDVFPSVDFDTIDAAEKKELRAKLKGVIYGLNFGRGAAAIAQAIGSSTAEAQRIIDLFFRNGARIGPWREWVISTVHTGEPLISRFGRRFQNEVVTPRNAAAVGRSALSFLPQSNSSDIVLRAAVKVHSELRDDPLRDWYVVALVHDAITLDVPKTDVSDAADYLSAEMVGMAARYFPEVPFQTDANWGRSWDETS